MAFLIITSIIIIVIIIVFISIVSIITLGLGSSRITIPGNLRSSQLLYRSSLDLRLLAMIASIIHFQILGALGFFVLTFILGAIASAISDG